jgi:uncharacterized membrane protein
MRWYSAVLYISRTVNNVQSFVSFSPNIVTALKLRMMIRTMRVARTGQITMHEQRTDDVGG